MQSGIEHNAAQLKQTENEWLGGRIFKTVCLAWVLVPVSGTPGCSVLQTTNVVCYCIKALSVSFHNFCVGVFSHPSFTHNHQKQ